MPAPVDSWFEEVEAQLRQADELAAVSDVESARAKVAELGGIEAVRRLERSLATERARLDHLAKRQQALACRLDTVDVAVDTLERVV